MLLVYLLIFVSGSQRFMLASNRNLLLAFGFTFLVWLIYTDRRISNRFVLYVAVFSGFLLVINLYTGGSLSLFSILGTVLKLLLAYFVLKTVGEAFVPTFINVVVVLAVASLIGYAVDTFHLFGGLVRALPTVSSGATEGFLYVFGFRSHIERNNSIFYEPGAYQIFLNAALFLLFFAQAEFSQRRRWFYTLILGATLLTTFSTTGYLIFGLMFALFLFKSDALSRKAKTVLVGMLAGASILFAAQFQFVVFNKLEDYTDIQDIRDTSNNRSFDPLVDMEIFKRHIFGVGNDRYDILFSEIGHVSLNATSSNGVTKLLAIYGLPFTVFLLGTFLWCFSRLLNDFIMTVATFGMLIMVFVGESYYVFTPLIMLIIAAAFVVTRPQQKLAASVA